MFSSVRAFIEPETSISNKILRGRSAPPQSSQPQHLAVVAHTVAQGAAQIGEGTAAGAHAAMTASPRQPRRRFAREAAQRIAGRAVRKAALDQRFGARRGKPGFVGFVGQRRLVLAASFLLQADGLFVFALRLLDRLAAAEVDVEQPVIGRAPLRRRRERRKPGLADVLQAARPEQFDRCKEGGGLLRRDGKSVGAQQGDKGDEDARGTRKLQVRRSRRRLRNQRVEPG